jgi:hypothetical protein
MMDEVEIEESPNTIIARTLHELEQEIFPKIDVDMNFINEMRNHKSEWKLPEEVEIPPEAFMNIDQLGEWMEKEGVIPKKKKKPGKSKAPKKKKGKK